MKAAIEERDDVITREELARGSSGHSMRPWKSCLESGIAPKQIGTGNSQNGTVWRRKSEPYKRPCF